MKKTLTIIMLFGLMFAQAQVGINTDTPQATLDVVGEPTNAKKLDGIILPRLTGNELRAKTYTIGQTGAMVYVTAADTAPGGQTNNVRSVGQYMFDGTVWVKQIGDTTNDAWINNPTTNVVELATKADGTTVRDAGTNVVITDAGRVGIGTTTPAHKLDVNGSMKVFTQNSSFNSGRLPTYGGINGTGQKTDHYTPFLRQKTPAGHYVNIGGYNETFGIFGFKTGYPGANNMLIMDVNTGNVGINTTVPSQRLDVSGGARIRTIPNAGATETVRVVVADESGVLKAKGLSTMVKASNGLNITSNDVRLGGKLDATTGIDLNGKNLNLHGSGRVGIATAAPTRTLDVNGGIRVLTPRRGWIGGMTGTAAITGTGHGQDAGYHPFLRQKTKSGHVVNLGGINDVFGFFGYKNTRVTNGVDYSMVMDLASGNIGINTTAPSQKLDVRGGARIRTIPNAGATETVRVVVADASGVLKAKGLSTMVKASNGLNITSNDVRLGGKLNVTTGIDLNGKNLNFHGAGNVGVGVTSPKHKLEVNGDVSIGVRGIVSAEGTVSWEEGPKLYFNVKDKANAQNNTDDIFMYRVHRAKDMTELRLSVGDNSEHASGQLHDFFRIGSTKDPSTQFVSHFAFNASAGKLGIGKQIFDPTESLEVQGNGKFTGSISHTSDGRYKEGVKTINKGVETIKRLNPVSYYWNAKGKENGGDDKKHLGFIAQELEKVLPNLVSTDKKGYKSVNYTELIPVLIKAIQEQQKEFEELKAIVQDLVKTKE